MKNLVTHIFLVTGLLALLLCVGLTSQSVEARPLSNSEVRRAIQAGQVVPYRVAVQRARAFTNGGDVLRAKLVNSGGRLVYRLRMLLPKGRVMIVFVDARSGQVIGSK